MNNIIFFDKSTFDIVKKIKTNEFFNDTNFVCIDNFCDKNLLTLKETFYIICSTKLNFISMDFLKFIQFCSDKKVGNHFKVVIFENEMEYADIILMWFKKLKDNFGLNFEIVSELEMLESSDIEKAISVLKNDSEIVVETIDELQIKNSVTIYTDGACSGNPGAGGWGAVLMHGEKLKEISGFDPQTTNNKMELTAVIMALSALKQKCSVELYSDSAYVVNAITQGWLANWKNNGWIGSDKNPVKNVELWQELDSLISFHKVNFNKVKGHADNFYNNRCDELATGEIAKNANL